MKGWVQVLDDLPMAIEESALRVAKWFAVRPEVETVLHPALPSCPGPEIWKRDFTGSSGSFSVVYRSRVREFCMLPPSVATGRAVSAERVRRRYFLQLISCFSKSKPISSRCRLRTLNRPSKSRASSLWPAATKPVNGPSSCLPRRVCEMSVGWSR